MTLTAKHGWDHSTTGESSAVSVPTPVERRVYIPC